MKKITKKLLSLFMFLVMLFSVTAEASFPAKAATLINSITIQEVGIPYPGESPSTNWSKTSTSWNADAINWYEVPDSGYDIPLSGDSKFVEGKKYKVSFVAWANSGYDFASPSSISATIDGFQANIAQYLGRDTKRVILVSYTFTCQYKKIKNVVLTCDSFEKNAELTTDFFYPQGEGVNPCCISTFTRNGESIAIGEKVTYGDYGASIILAPMENYKFDDNVNIQLGEKKFTVTNRIGMGIVAKSADNLWHIDCEHSYGSYKYDATTCWMACENCGDKTNLDTHDFEESTIDGDTVYTCSICNYVKTVKNKVGNYFYADVENGVQITAYDGSETNITIPSSLDGKNVVSIGDFAFSKYANKTTLESITLPSGITSIGRGAFNGCSALASVNIPSSVKRIEAETFIACSQLKNISIPYGVNFIGANAFQNSGISSIILPCSVKTIKGSAFRSCEALGSIIIPDSVTELGNAFISCSALKNVTIGSGISSIQQATFDGCTAIKTLTLPAELTTIDKYNFDSGSVTTVNYRGTQAQFDEMNITTNTDLTSATKNYNYTEKIDIGQHKYIVAQTVAPTCIEDGYTLHMCEGCGDTFQNDIAPKTGVHTYNSGAISTKPTCVSTGIKTYLCKDCGVAKTETVATTGKHTCTDTITKATLSNDGKKESKCTVCKAITATTTIYHPETIQLEKTSYAYNGKVQTPEIIVKDCKGNTLKEDTDFTITYTGNAKNVGTYQITVTMKGNYDGNKVLTYKINPQKTSVSKLTSGKKKLKVKLKKRTKQVTGYEIQYSTSKKFKKAVTKTKLIKKYKKVSVTLKKLKSKKTYYVRVRTYKTASGQKYYSDWSAYKKKKTK